VPIPVRRQERPSRDAASVHQQLHRLRQEIESCRASRGQDNRAADWRPLILSAAALLLALLALLKP